MTHLLLTAAQVNIGPRCWIPDGCSVEIQHVCGVPDRRLPFPWEKRLSGNRHAPSGEKESLCLMSAVAILTACRRISCLNIEITAKRLVADIYSYRPPSSSSSSLFFLPGKEKGKKMRKITARHEFLFFNLIKKRKEFVSRYLWRRQWEMRRRVIPCGQDSASISLSSPGIVESRLSIPLFFS